MNGSVASRAPQSNSAQRTADGTDDGDAPKRRKVGSKKGRRQNGANSSQVQPGMLSSEFDRKL